jgi:hypothetical protein
MMNIKRKSRQAPEGNETKTIDSKNFIATERMKREEEFHAKAQRRKDKKGKKANKNKRILASLLCVFAPSA